MANFTDASPLAGQNDELNAIAAVVIGGASLFGGRGHMLGTVVGTFIIALLVTGLVLVGVSGSWQEVATGVIVVAAVAGDQVRLRLRRAMSHDVPTDPAHIEREKGGNMTHRRWFSGLRSRAAIGVAVLGLVASTTLAVTAGTGATAAGAASKYTITLIPGLTDGPLLHHDALRRDPRGQEAWGDAQVGRRHDLVDLELQIPVVKSVLASKPNALLIAPTDDVALFKPDGRVRARPASR